MSVVNGTATNDIYGMVLAAGSASRFGSLKQIEAVDGVPLVRRAVQLSNAVLGDRTLLVLGHEWREVCRASAAFDGFLTVNDRYSEGVGTSIAAGVRSIRHVASAIVLLLADQPLITPRHLSDLVGSWSGTDNEIVATAFAGTSGPPVLFPRACFGDLCRLEGDVGARKLLQDRRYKLTRLDFEDAATDIDTPSDLRHVGHSARN